MPALDALAHRLHAAHTLGAGVSVDSVFSNAAWAAELGGVSVPLLSDFHPKGAVAKRLGCYLEERGITGRATVFIDADGVVRRASMHSSQRDLQELTDWIEAFDAQYAGELPPMTAQTARTEDLELFIKEGCTFSRWARYAVTNLHLRIPVLNVTRDANARSLLEDLGGKSQAPALRIGERVLYESAEIRDFLVQRSGSGW